MCFDEALRLHKHATGAAARVVHAPFEELDHLHKHTDDAARREELAAKLSLGLRKLAEKYS